MKTACCARCDESAGYDCSHHSHGAAQINLDARTQLRCAVVGIYHHVDAEESGIAGAY